MRKNNAMICVKEKIKSIKILLPKSALVILAFFLSLALPIKFAQAFSLFTLAGLSAGFFYGVVAELLGIIANTVLGGILWFVSWIFDIALKLSTQKADIVNYGWEVSLKFANMFFIIILLAIAIGTILNTQKFNKSLLPQFFMVALLINFSMVIGGVIIDATNVFALFFSNEIGKAGFSISEGLMGALGANIVTTLTNTSATLFVNTVTNFVNILILSFYQIIIQLSAIFILAAGAVFMILRTFHLWTLLMISPLAWIAMIIPGQKKHWDTWWDQFIKWSLFAPVFLFFTYLALIIASKATQIFAEPTSSLSQTVSNFTLNPVNIIQLVAVVFLMFFGIVAGQKMGVAGSNFVLSYGKGLKDATAKRFKELRSKGPLSPEELGKRFGTLGARGLAAIPGAGRIAGYGKIQEKLEKERLEKARESNEKKIKDEKAKIENMDVKEAWGEFMAAKARGDTSPKTAALGQLLKEQRKILEMEFEAARSAGQAQIATASGNLFIPMSKQDNKNYFNVLNENIRRAGANALIGQQSGITYL